LSTQQILGVVGGVVGAFFGYPQLGFVVGSLVGGLLTPGEKSEGPRVDDLKVQVSTYGAGITILYGTERIGGNVVWSTDKIETSETQGGKGGEPEHTTYRYFVHMGIVLCETPRDGSEVKIAQIFQDGKLIYDTRLGIPIGSALASAENPHAFFVLYQGHADQLPDPIEELLEGGPGSVPAYRGVVRIRMNAIECPGGRVPQYSFVLSANATQIQEDPVFAEVPAVGSTALAWAVVRRDAVWHINRTGFDFAGNLAFPIYYCTYDSVSLQKTIHYDYVHNGYQPIPVSGDGPPCFLRAVEESLGLTINKIDLETGVATAILDYDPDGSNDYLGNTADSSAGFEEATGIYVVRGGGSDRQHRVTIIDALTQKLTDLIPGAPGPVTIKNSVVYALSVVTGNLVISRYNASTGALIASDTGPANADSSSITWAALHPSDEGVFVWIRNVSPHPVYLVTFGLSATWTLISSNVDTTGADKLGGVATTFYADRNVALIGPSTEQGLIHRYNLSRFNVFTVESVQVSDIIADQCERAGETRYDLSEIPATDVLHGYKLQNPASARSNVDPLLTGFAIYIVDEDGVIKFKKYEDIESEATIAYHELGQAEDGSEPADAMPLNRAQEIDMPRSVTVSYIEPTFDYQTASEPEYRQITEATEDLIVELPMATTSDHAKQVASMILFAKWRAQNTRSFKTSRKYAFLSPGDGVTVEYPRGTFRLWRITSMTDTGVLCEFNVEPGDAELYTQTGVGASGYVTQQVQPLATPTRLQLIDGPILKDEDNNAGIYAALMRTAGELFVGDDDASLVSRGTTSVPAIGGVTETALGAWTPNIMDETNTLIVNIGSGELSTTTRALLYTSTANAAIVGDQGRWEVIQFLRASSLGGGRYLLSGLLRGLRGTEHNRANHQQSDMFVLLTTAGILRPSMDVGAIGSTKSYRAIAKGRSRDSAASQTYANTAEGLSPFAPWDLRKSKAATNDQTLTWKRRTRLSSNALRGIVPLGEATESWSIDLYTTSGFTTLAGTLTSTTSSLLITSAQQTLLGLTPGAALNVRVYQVSDSVGRGAVLQGTI